MAAHARTVRDAYLAESEQRLALATGALALSPDEAGRTARFRSNILRRTRPFHSEPTHFHYPGLREREFHDRDAFPWLAALEAATDAIRADFERVLAAERAELVPYIQYPDDVPLRQWKGLNRNRDWTAIHLVRNGTAVEANARHCPATMALLGALDQPVIPRRGPNAMFSLLAPGAHIPPHTGVANTRLVCHLPLIVPGGCWFRVGAETRVWETGKAWVFDDTIEHEAMNPSDALRVLLIVDTWHPDLSAAERGAVAAIMAATDPDDALEGTVTADAAWLLRTADPNNADSVFRAAAVAVRSGLEEEALALARRGAALHPQDARMWQMIGLGCRRLDDLGPAVEAFARAAALAPGDALIAHSLARTSMEAGLAAVSLFERALALAPDDPSVLLGMAAAQLAEGKPLEAIEGLDAVLARHPRWIDGHATVSRLRWINGAGDGFTASFERALRELPRDADLWRELINSWMHPGRYDMALATIARARAASGPSPAWDMLEAIAHAEAGEIETADRLFAALGGIDHITVAARYMRHLLRAGRPAEASAFADGWEGRDPDQLLTPYLSAAWRLTGDERWQWLEGDERLVGVYDLADRLPSIDALADRLRGLHLSTHQPLEQSVRGGTQTDGPLFSRIDPEIRALRDLIRETVEAHVAQLPAALPGHPSLPARRAPIRFSGSWSVRLTDAGFHVNHVHPAGWFSSAFYVALPDPDPAGDPHAGWLSIGEASELGLDLPPLRMVEPRPGRLVLFPSTMWHGTRPFPRGERLTVAFDVARPPQ